MMKSFQMSDDFVYDNLTNGEVVVYSPKGTATPFVLSGIPLLLFNKILEGLSFQEIKHWARNENLDDNKINTILNWFIFEQLIIANKEKDNSRDYESKQLGKKLSLWIYTTDICNLRCDYCYVSKGKSTLSNDTVHNLAESLKNDISLNGVAEINIKFAGGEPLVAHEKMFHLAELLKNELSFSGVKLNFSIITNGTKVTHEIARKIKNLRFNVFVSIDGVANFNKARKYQNGANSIDDVIHGINIFQSEGVNPKLLSVVTNENILGLFSLTDFALIKSLPLNFSFSRAINENGELIISTEIFKSELVKFIKYLNSPNSQHLRLVSFSNLNFRGKHKRACGAGENYFAVSTNGDVSTCHMTTNQPIKNLENLKTGLSSIAKSTPPRIQNIPECSTCVWRYSCASGCEVLANQTRKHNEPTPFCEIYKVILPHLLVFEGRKIQEKRKYQ